MRKMNLRGKRFIKKVSDLTFMLSLSFIWIIFTIYVLFYELKETHSTELFKNVITILIILGIITGLCEYISERCEKSIRREVKAKKAKTWWVH